jgi:hypothetical protein
MTGALLQMKKLIVMFVFAAILFSACKDIAAQSVSGMTGTVVDSSGAVVPGATVTLTNKVRGLTFTQITNSSGAYRFSDIPPGDGYEATFTFGGSGGGFAPLAIKNIYLTVATIRTQNATLVVGAHTEVEVTASNSTVTINTEDASIGNVFDVKQLNNLPVQQRNDPTALFTQQPGVTESGSVTGARTDQNNITLDGLDVNDFATGNASQTNSGVSQGFSGSIVGHAPVDSVQEFRGTVAGMTSSSGPGGGGQFNLVTRSGTNQFHGNINEYHRDPSLVANSWFSNNASPIIPRNHLIQNQFGGSIGGPVLRNKLYFFFDYNNSRIISSKLTFRTVPLDSLRNGNVQYLNQAGGLGSLTPAQIKALDPAGIGNSPTWLAGWTARFPHSNAAGGDGINSGGYNFNAPDNDFATNYVGRVDYNLTSSMKMFARFTISRENSTENVNEFAGDPPSNPFIDRTYAFVIGHSWVIGANKTNQFYIGETVQKYDFPNTFNPSGSTFLTLGDGTQASLASSLYLNPSSQSRRIPIPMIGDDFTWSKGNHTMQFGGTFKNILAKNNNSIDYNTTEVGLGGQTLGLNASLRPLDINTSAANANTANQTYDQAFAFMLARIGNVQSDYNYDKTGTVLPQLTGDQRIYRNYQTQLYFGDTWKIRPNLTLSYGVNYQLFSVPYETRGLESTETTTFNDYFAARAKQSAAGISGPNAVPLISYILGGKANNGPALYKPQYNLFAPRFAFSYNPGFDKKTVFNGGAGIVYDRTVINAVQQIQDQDSYLFQQTKSTAFGVPGDPVTSLATDPRLDKNNGISNVTLVPPATPKPPYQPFVNTDCSATPAPCGLQNGLAFNATIDPALKTPYSITYNFGMQTQLPSDFILKISYAGRLGRRLLAQADANQIIDFPDKTSGQFLSQAFSSITLQNRAGVNPLNVTPQAWFEHVIPPGTGAGFTYTDAGGVKHPFTSNTQFVAYEASGLVHNGDFADFNQFLSNFTDYNVGMGAQFSENTFYTNQGFSSYNGLLVSLQKNLSHGLQFDLNYTWSHSIDNSSFFANSEGDTGIGGVGLVCDVARPRICRGNSDFDITNYITADEIYQLPFGKGRQFLASSNYLTNMLIGGWDISGITEYHSGTAWGTASNAFVASYSNDAPAILVGSPASVGTHVQRLSGGGVNIFKSQAAASAAYVGPIGFQIGSRNSLRGPQFFNQDLGLAKTFPIVGDRLNLKFRADAFNAFNHPNFSLPQENGFNGFDQQDVTSTTFGNISNTVSPPGNLNNGARVLQLALRLEF